MSDDTPFSMGYKMPAEWEPHRGTWLSWPKDPNTFPSGILPKVEAAYAKMAGALGKGEEVNILVDDEKAETRAKSMVKGGGRVAFRRIRTLDVWVRDYGPIYVKGKDLALTKWVFNAWGNKYDDLKPDNESGEAIARSTRLRTFRPGLVLEGGSVDVNGRGTLLTTEQCLLNRNRNPTLDSAGLSKAVRDYLGASHILWLGRGIEGDDTDGHVDDIARFVGPRRVVAAVEPKESDPNHTPLEENLRVLRESKDQDGKSLDVVEIPMPRTLRAEDGRLPASHLNFYIGNRVVLVPTFGGDSGRVALRALESEFPKREVLGVDCRALVYGLGTIHCVTQQIPEG